MSTPTLAQRVYPAVLTLGAGLFTFLDKGMAPEAAALAFGSTFLGSLLANRISSKTDKEEQDAALASTLIQNAQITNHCGLIIAALVRDASRHGELRGQWEAPLAALADAIPRWWSDLCAFDPHFAASLQGQRFIHSLTSVITEENPAPILATDAALQLLTAAAEKIDHFPAGCLPTLADKVSSRFNEAVTAGLAKPSPVPEEAFRKTLLRFLAETLATTQQHLALSRETFTGVHDIRGGVERLIDYVARTYSEFSGYFEEILSRLSRVERKVDTLLQNQTAAGAEVRLTAYRAGLLAAFREYTELGLTNYRSADDSSPDIWDIFVAPACSREKPISPKEMDDAQRAKDPANPAEDLLPILADPTIQRHVLLADPGMGKSVLIQQLTCALVDGHLPPEAAGLRGAIPIPVVLRELIPLLKDRQPDTRRWTWDLLCEVLRESYRHGSHALYAQYKDRCHFHDELLASPRAFFLIDGLDEIGSTAGREQIKDAIQDGFLACPQARWLITSRIVGYEQAQVHETSMEYAPIDSRSRVEAYRVLERWRQIGFGGYDSPESSNYGMLAVLLARVLYLAPFDDARQRRFLANWFALRNTDDTTPGLLEEVHAHSNDGIRLIARVPNLLCYMAMLKRGKQPLPHGRAELYKEIARAYIESIDGIYKVESKDLGHECPFPHDQRHYLLALLAADMQSRRIPDLAKKNKAPDAANDGNILITQADVCRILQPAAARFLGKADASAEVLEFLRHITCRSGLLIDRGTSHEGQPLYAFTHLSFLEYFAACWLRDRIVDEDNRRRDIVDEVYDEATWLRDHPPGPIEASPEHLQRWTARAAWHEVLLFLTELRAANADDLRSLLRKFFPALHATTPPPTPGRKDGNPVPLLPAQSVRLALRIATDRYLRDIGPTRTLWLRRLWHAYLLWPYISWTENGWPIAPILLEHPDHQIESLAALDHIIEAHSLHSAPLDLSECTGLSSLEHLPRSVQKLDLFRCTGLTSIAHIPVDVKTLYLTGCTGLVSLEHLPAGVKTLYIDDCSGLTSLEHLPQGVQKLRIANCAWLTVIELIPKTLRHLDVEGCKNLVSLGPLPPALRHINIRKCQKLNEETRRWLREWAINAKGIKRMLIEFP